MRTCWTVMMAMAPRPTTSNLSKDQETRPNRQRTISAKLIRVSCSWREHIGLGEVGGEVVELNRVVDDGNNKEGGCRSS
ncbi:hypothetical protein L484_009277 [Morus notabilis]|uniref:Uncharacterized protein n=1 Tax=Morus notabilis TaxID=981085 RepID=W9QYK1_9ROSA|nr:hypothetical protein L484_009277 [Morus notabilis]